MIELYGMSSPNVLKVMIMLEEAALPYHLHHMDLMAGDQFTSWFRSLNPNCKVPVIVDPDGPDSPTMVFESGAILLYLAERTGILYPASFAERTRVSQWLMFQMAGLGPMVGQAIHFTLVNRDNHYAQARYVNELGRLLDVLETRLGDTDYISGIEYSVADIAVWPWVRTVKRFFKDMPERPCLTRWYDVIAQRPAVGRAVSAVVALSQTDKGMMSRATDLMRDRYYGRRPA